MKRILYLTVAVLLTACTAREPLSLAVVHSEMQRNPEASCIDGLEGRLKWNYTTGLELKAFLDVYDRLTNEGANDRPASPGAGGISSQGLSSGPGKKYQSPAAQKLLNYVDAWYDAIIAEDGTIGVNYKKENYSTDHICPGRTLFRLYDITGKEKYRRAMDRLYEQLQEQPRTPEGGFWHKKIYPQQMWLDGIYMAQPFYAEYAARYLEGPEQAAAFEDIVRQMSLVADRTFDEATGLFRHAWDASHAQFWCDPATGQSAHAWGRAMGWYTMALVDVLPLIPEDTPGADRLQSLLRHIANQLPRYADPQTGMWYQVLDRPGAEGNYVEATCSAMFVYALLKGCRLGCLDCPDYARESYGKLLKTFVTREDGLVTLNRCCEVAGLGGKENRSGDYTYYINEKIRSNDPKGIGPLIWAALEYECL
mgnify:CR=1 FL=1